MRNLPWIAKKWLILFVINATVFGCALDFVLGNKIDYWIHDAAVVFQARSEWKNTAIVVLDDAVPIQVSRQQALPLFARATEKAISVGAKGVFLDARIPKEIEGNMPYAVCFEKYDIVRWSKPKCQTKTHNQCELKNSLAGNAPLNMKGFVFPYFRIAPYLSGSTNLPDFLLYGLEAESFIPNAGLVVSDRLVTKNSPINRWIDLSNDHAVIKLAKFMDAKKVTHSLRFEDNEVCDQGIPCRRIRLTRPHYDIQFSSKQPIIPVSHLASCDDSIANMAALALKNRVVILQLSSPSEANDMLITPMTSALMGPHLLTPGAQFLADAVETLLNNDHPREPHRILKLTIFLMAALISVYAGAYLMQFMLWGIGIAIFLTISALCFFSPLQQLWPITTTMLTFVIGAIQIIGIHLLIGFRQGKLITQYMPKQVHHLLLPLKENEIFQRQNHQAIVLMSDMAGYTTITSILKEPSHVLELINDYLSKTSFILQTKYEGWLETYIGDMVCYYWPFRNENKDNAYRNALMGAIELSLLQKRFFSELVALYKNKFEANKLQSISHIINAGIGLSSGTVVMGDLGPKDGVRKFGILGDPLNLAARIESLTRHFNTDILVTADFFGSAKALGYPTRYLGRFCVKGRPNTERLYAIGSPSDPRFQQHTIDQWENWIAAAEQGISHNIGCPEVFNKDKSSFIKWEERGLLKGGTWYLDEK